MAKNHWKTAQRIAKDISKIESPHWSPINRNDGGGGGGFGGTYEWNLLSGAAASVSMKTIYAKAALHSAGALSKMVTGHDAIDSIRDARGARNRTSKKKTGEMVGGSCSRMRLTAKSKDDWFRIKLYAGVNKGQGFVEEYEMFSGWYFLRGDSLRADNGLEIKAPWKRRSLRRGAATARFKKSPDSIPSGSDSSSNSGSGSYSSSSSGSGSYSSSSSGSGSD